MTGFGGTGVSPICAVSALKRASSLVLLTMDQLVENRHYHSGTPIDLLARKAIARSLSDIAAMAGRPRCLLVAATLGDSFTKTGPANKLSDALARWADHWRCPLVGGDIAFSPRPTVLTVTVLGSIATVRGPVKRSDALPGDLVCITGTLGGSLESGRHLTFEPRIEEAIWLAETLGSRLGAMIDVSDGLGRDAGRIASASNVRISLDASAIPLAPGAMGWRAAVADGEDYELCFTVRGTPPPATSTGVPITVVGAVEDADTPSASVGRASRPSAASSSCGIITPEGERIDAEHLGWDHRV